MFYFEWETTLPRRKVFADAVPLFFDNLNNWLASAPGPVRPTWFRKFVQTF
jgi:hypothetical protein